MRIVHCFRSPVGGIFRHVRDLAQAQSAAGHDVGIICDSSTGGAYEDSLIEEARPFFSLGVERTPMQRHVGPGDLMSAGRTLRLIAKMQPDILHGHGAKGGVYARLFGTLRGLQGKRPARIYTAHGGSLHYDEKTPTGRVFFALEALMSGFSDHILFVSDFERRTYLTKVGEPKCPSTLVYNGLQRQEFEQVETAPDAADFLYIGMMRDLKGPDLFLDALAMASNRLNKPLRAVMVGDGEDLPKYRAQAIQLGLDTLVQFKPAMPAREAFALARFIVVPSRAEAMPYIVLEALAAGRPMIATNVGGIPEVFPAGSPALCLPEAPSIAEGMLQGLRDERAFQEAMPGPGELKRRFGADVMAQQIEDAYRAAMKSD
ncbi:glycosyltransferase family 4 protein [Nitratireductor basaltis]|uniref:Glycosyl transferase group 1 n=1 Tax=Nitratireductor basaltis TaxID=472175 RepID=A0A084UBV2_9HYPH|nr:Glycosyl transferase group 1 [Nitratireductor basaltis]